MLNPTGRAALAARLAAEDRRAEWQRRLIQWGVYERAELHGSAYLPNRDTPPDWYGPLCAAIDALPPDHADTLRRVYVEGEHRLQHRRALGLLLSALELIVI